MPNPIQLSSDNRPNVFYYDDYTSMLMDYLEFLKSNIGISFRQVGKLAGFKSPNYIQKIVSGHRRLTIKSAENLGKALGLNEDEKRYFCLLVKRQSDTSNIQALTRELEALRNRVNAEVSSDKAMFDSWLNGVIWELAPTLGPEFSLEKLMKRLNHVASHDAISASFNFLTQRQYLQRTPRGDYVQKPIIFKYPNDRNRDLEIQQSHNTYLKMAQHRLNDSLADREFQGLTIAVSGKKMDEIKSRIRAFLSTISEELADDDQAEQVMRIQVCAFQITK